MNDREKLKHLVAHWEEHNVEHAHSYNEWSKKMGAIDHREAQHLLDIIAEKTLDLGSYFKELRRLLD